MKHFIVIMDKWNDTFAFDCEGTTDADIQKAVRAHADDTTPDPGDFLKVGIVEAPDAGWARLDYARKHKSFAWRFHYDTALDTFEHCSV